MSRRGYSARKFARRIARGGYRLTPKRYRKLRRKFARGFRRRRR